MKNQNNQIELRNMRLEGVKENADGSFFVSGYVNEYSWSEVLGTTTKFRERIVPGAFTRALARAKNVEFLYEHDKEKILADTKSGKLTLKENERGLFMEAKIVPTTWGKDAYALIKEGVIQNMSFGFRKLKDEMTKGANGIYERVVEELELVEVTCTRNPAYVQSSIQARSLEIAEDIKIGKEINEMNKNEIKNELSSILKQGKELESLARKENRSLNEFEQAEKQDLLQQKGLFEAQLKEIEDAEQRNIVEIAEVKSQEITAEQRTMEALVYGEETDETRALGLTADGSKLLPSTVSNDIYEKVVNQSKLYGRVGKTDGGGYKKYLYEDSNAGHASFIGEWKDATSGDFGAPRVVTLGQKRLGTAVVLSDAAVYGSGMPVVPYATKILNKRMSRTLDERILIGVGGATDFEGVLTHIGVLKVEAKSSTEITFDELRELIFTSHPNYVDGSKNAIALMHPNTFKYLTTIKDEQGYPMIKPKPEYFTAGFEMELFGLPIVLEDLMPEIGAGKSPIIVGDFLQGYVVKETKELGFQHIWKGKARRSTRSHLLLMDAYLDGKVAIPEAFAKLTMKTA